MMKYYEVITSSRKVAGQHNPGKGSQIALTEEQAAQPLRLGHIRVPKPAKSTGKKTKS